MNELRVANILSERYHRTLLGHVHYLSHSIFGAPCCYFNNLTCRPPNKDMRGSLKNKLQNAINQSFTGNADDRGIFVGGRRRNRKRRRNKTNKEKSKNKKNERKESPSLRRSRGSIDDQKPLIETDFSDGVVLPTSSFHEDDCSEDELPALVRYEDSLGYTVKDNIDFWKDTDLNNNVNDENDKCKPEGLRISDENDNYKPENTLSEVLSLNCEKQDGIHVIEEKNELVQENNQVPGEYIETLDNVTNPEQSCSQSDTEESFVQETKVKDTEDDWIDSDICEELSEPGYTCEDWSTDTEACSIFTELSLVDVSLNEARNTESNGVEESIDETHWETSMLKNDLNIKLEKEDAKVVDDKSINSEELNEKEEKYENDDDDEDDILFSRKTFQSLSPAITTQGLKQNLEGKEVSPLICKEIDPECMCCVIL